MRDFKKNFLSNYFFCFLALIFCANSLVAQAPANDDRANAILITLDANGDYNSALAEFSTVGATADGQPTDVWFKFSPSTTGILDIKVLRGYDDYGTGSYIQMRLEDSVGNLITSEGAGTPTINNGLFAEGLNPLETYYLSVGNRPIGNSTGTFTLQIDDEGDYNHRAYAHEITLDANGDYNSTLAEFSTVGATVDGQPTDVWFKFSPSTTGILDIKVLRGYDSHGTGSYIQMRLEDSFGNLITSEGAGTPTINNGLFAEGLNSLETYYLSVGNRSIGNSTGTFTLQIDDEGDYNHRAYAHEITLDANGDYNSALAEFSTVGATADGQPTDVWFKFNPSTTGILDIKVLRGYDSHGTGSYIQMRLEDSVGNLITSEGAGTPTINNGLFAEGLNPFETYYLSVGNRSIGNSTGTFTLQIDDEGDYNHRAYAHEITLDANGDYNSALAEFSTVGATADGQSTDVWFKFNPSTTGILDIKVLRGYDSHGTGSYIQMRLEDSVGNLITSEGAGTPTINNGLFAEGLNPFETYYLSVGNRSIGNSTGTFTLQIDDEGDYNHRDYAHVITLDANGDYSSPSAEFSTVGATADGQPTDVWFKFNPGSSGTLDIRVLRGHEDYGTASYIQMRLEDESGNLVGSEGAGSVSLINTISVPLIDASETYYLSVGNRAIGNSTGTFTLVIDFVSDVQCTTELWAIASGAWNDPNIWSAMEGGQPVTSIPCETTVVYIKGFDVSFNSTGIETVKRVEIIGTNINTLTRLNIKTGELNVKEEVVTSGPGAQLKSVASAKLRVTGGD